MNATTTAYQNFYKTYYNLVELIDTKRTNMGTQDRANIRTDLWRYLGCEEVLAQMRNDTPFIRSIYNKLEWHLARDQLDGKEQEAATSLKDSLTKMLHKKAEVKRFPLLKTNSILWQPLIAHLNSIPDDYREAIYYELRNLEAGQTRTTIRIPRKYDRGDFLDAVEETFTHLAPCFGISFSSDESFSYCNLNWNGGSILVPSEINPHFRMAIY